MIRDPQAGALDKLAVSAIQSGNDEAIHQVAKMVGVTPEALKAAAQWDGIEPGGATGKSGEPVRVVSRVPMMVSLADVQSQPVQWLWPGRIAMGKLTLIAGDPGLGKSFITLDLAARISTGVGWPDAPDQRFEPGGVVLLSAEDDLADTIRPRLDAAGADVTRIKAIESVKYFDPQTGGEAMFPFSLELDLPALEQAIAETSDCRLVIIDPVTAYLGSTDSHKNADVRALLAPMAALAGRYGVALVVVSHLNKSNGGPAMYRITGSGAFPAAARAAWAVTKDRDDPTGQRRLFLPVKNNLGTDQSGLAYRLAPANGGMATVAWESEPVTVTADDAMTMDRPGGDDERTARDEAMDWLRQALASGPVEAALMLADAKTNGIAKRTLDRAKRELGVEPFKPAFGGGWFWRLPSQECQNSPLSEVATLGDSGNLRETVGAT